MGHLIDSDWVIDHLAENAEAQRLLDRLLPDGVALSLITYMEVYQGTLRQPDPAQAQARMEEFVAAVPVLPFTVDVAKRCAELREALDRQGRRVRARALDLINAATALHYDLILVTRNIGDYDDIPDLRLYRPS